MSTHKVLYQNWEWHGEYDGISPADGSMHLDAEDRLAYIKARRGPILDRVPEDYEVPGSQPEWVEVDDDLYAQIVAAKPGLRVTATTTTAFKAVPARR